MQILRYGGMGHTMSIHSQNEPVILEFGLKKPAFRIVVNTPTTHGAIGLTTGLDPAMTLGCGGYGGNITSDNISPRHLLNIKRVAYELRPATTHSAGLPRAAERPALPQPPARPGPVGVEAAAVSRSIDALLPARDTVPPPPPATPAVAEFVCEDDVRQALKLGRQIVINDKTIVTPLARDAGAAARVFVQAGLAG
jgi:acetaldehyde dehydrogenase (acetylating)